MAAKAVLSCWQLSLSQLFERLKDALGVTEPADPLQKDQYEAQLTELQVFIKKIEPFLKQLKTDLAGFLSTE